VGDLERKAVRRRLLVQPAAVGRGERSAKHLDDTALARCVFRLLVDRAGFIEVITVASTILRTESRFDLDLAFHVA
jgi:ADP-ribosylglycohydrolase